MQPEDAEATTPPSFEKFVGRTIQGELDDAGALKRAVAAIRILKQEVEDAYRVTLTRTRRLACTYQTAYLLVRCSGKGSGKGRGKRVAALNRDVGIAKGKASRLRKLAKAEPFIERYKDNLPPDLECVYEIVRGNEDDPDRIQNAIAAGTVTAESDLEQCRALRKACKTRPADEDEHPAVAELPVVADTVALRRLQARLTFTVPKVLGADQVDAFADFVAKTLQDALTGIGVSFKWSDRRALVQRLTAYHESVAANARQKDGES